MEQIKKIVLADGTELDATGLAYISTTSKGNLQIATATDSGKKVNIESDDNIEFKAKNKIRLDTSHQEETDEVNIAVINDSKTKVQGIKLECAGLKFETDNADATNGWDKNTFKMLFKKKSGATDTWAKLNMHAASIDLRTRNTGKGTGGGIAAQISGVDSSLKENKFKIETDRTVDVTETTTEANHNGEGGKGIEILTINSQFFSAYNKTYRFRKDAPVYAVTRGTITEVDGKSDFPTQSDDSKDIIPTGTEVTWGDIIKLVQYFKDNNLAPFNG